VIDSQGDLQAAAAAAAALSSARAVGHLSELKYPPRIRPPPEWKVRVDAAMQGRP
jgi:hypothetical protein